MVYRFNTRIRTVPALLVARVFGWRERPFFKAEEAERETPDATL
jgi:hypothetical protein